MSEFGMLGKNPDGEHSMLALKRVLLSPQLTLKSITSAIFQGKKDSYPQSVAHPFVETRISQYTAILWIQLHTVWFQMLLEQISLDGCVMGLHVVWHVGEDDINIRVLQMVRHERIKVSFSGSLWFSISQMWQGRNCKPGQTQSKYHDMPLTKDLLSLWNLAPNLCVFLFLQYSVPVVKYDRKGYKPRQRQLIFTQAAAYLADEAKVKQRVAYANLKGDLTGYILLLSMMLLFYDQFSCLTAPVSLLLRSPTSETYSRSLTCSSVLPVHTFFPPANNRPCSCPFDC